MADTKTPAMLLDELAPLDPNSGVRWPQLCGLWPRRSRGARRSGHCPRPPDAGPPARLRLTGADWYLSCRLGGPLPIPVPRMCALRRADPGQRTLFGTTGEAEPEMRTARPRSPNAGGRARGEKKGLSP